MNTNLLKKILFVMVLGAVICLVESFFFEIAKFQIYHHLLNGLLCLVIVTIIAKTKYGYLLGFLSKPTTKIR
jgi:hypothetical protein